MAVLVTMATPVLMEDQRLGVWHSGNGCVWPSALEGEREESVGIQLGLKPNLLG